MATALIAGAGIGGLAAGIALRRAGWDIRIFEAAAAPRAIGFALGLAPNAMAALRELGVAGAVMPRGDTAAAQDLAAEIRRPDGRVIRRLVVSRHRIPAGDRPGVVLRSALHGALLDALRPGAPFPRRTGETVVETNRAAERFDIDGGGVRLHLSDGASATGDILIGADGAGSTIRACLHPAEASPQPSGYFAVRGISRAFEQMNGLQAIWYLGPGVESGVIQTNSNEIYWFVSLLADEVKAGPLDVDSVMLRCTAGFDRQFHAVTGATAPGDMRLDELLARPPLDHWGAGPVTLLGDAAHPMLPHTGQGAAQALEDAVGLGRAMQRRGDPIAALRAYERVRSRRTRRFVEMGPRLARVTTTRSPIAGALRNFAVRLVPAGVLVKAFTRREADPHRELGESLRPAAEHAGGQPQQRAQ